MKKYLLLGTTFLSGIGVIMGTEAFLEKFFGQPYAPVALAAGAIALPFFVPSLWLSIKAAKKGRTRVRG